jgi:hypothetical protein
VEPKQPSEIKKEPACSQKKQVTNTASGQSIQEKTVNSNAMDDRFVAFTMVQQTMTISRATSGEKKIAIITKVVFSIIKHNGSNNS